MSDTSVAGTRPLNLFLKMAVMAGVESAIQIHIDRGDDLNARDANGLTLLMLSAARNKPAMCKLLLDAGADKGLLDSAGRTALAIAVAAGAHEAASILVSKSAPIGEVGERANCANTPFDWPIVPLSGQGPERPTYLFGVNATEPHKAPAASHAHAKEAIAPENTPDHGLIDWEPEEDRLPPVADSSVAQAASVIQAAITGYEPIDSSADWEDIDAYLPERSLPLVRTDNVEVRERLRLLLLRAIREGSVPRMEVEALSCNDDRSANPQAEALLSMVVNDLGAEVDERLEYASASESFEVFVKPEETPDEEEIVADALGLIDSLASHHTEPLRIYQKAFQRERLISAQEEVALGQAMENGFERALDALAAWPCGIGLTLAAGRLVMTGQRPLTWMALGPAESQPDLNPFLEGESDAEAATPDQADEEVEPDGDSQFAPFPPLGNYASDFMDSLGELASLPASAIQQRAGGRAAREILSSLRLNRRFLLELADVADGDDAEAATKYAGAMTEHESARERMVVANLKLVFHLSKKYLYSGEPLDDLAQAGNIGLLKAVDRFDWRRGFKFSTYATWWIRQQIGRHVADKCRTIRLPVHMYEKTQRLAREMLAFESETGRAPELDEIAARMDMPAHKVAAIQHIAPEPLIIHELPIDEMIAIEVRSDFVSQDPMDIVSESELREAIVRVLSTLKPKEAQILRLRFGIGVPDSLTLDEIGQRYEVTRERIRQIEAKALRKLRHPSRADALANVGFGGPFFIEGQEEEVGPEPEHAEQSTGLKSTQRPATLNIPPGNLTPPRPAQSSSLDRILSQAAALGIPIADDRDGPSGRIRVNFIGTPDIRYRKLVRKLLALGFELCPEKGYWK
jgi:RNA polymerase primary sigma factor